MKRNLVHNFSINTLQLVLNQLFALIIFYLLSIHLDKNNFGQLNLVLAILMAVFNMLSLGIDQLVIKKIASGESVQSTLSLYIFHVVVTGSLFYLLLFLGRLIFPQDGGTYSLLLFIGIGKLMIFFSTPFKQVANGMERFKLLAYMSIISNLMRALCLVIFSLANSINFHLVVILFITGDLVELLFSIVLTRYAIKVPLSIKWEAIKYVKLLREAIPQTGVVVINSALARFDWIFIGLTLSAIKLAEYSFAYKVFEIATLPLLAIAPLLIPLFTKLFQQQEKQPQKLAFLLKIEIMVALLIAMVINICWAPVIDSVTSGKYGAVNVITILALTLCMPFLYINNFFWTIYFAQGRLKTILASFVVTLLVNIAGDVLLIPLYKNEGAAVAFLLSCLAQTIFYLKKNEIDELKVAWQSLIICVLCAVASGLIVHAFLSNNWIIVPLCILFYIVLLFCTFQLRISDREKFRELLKW